MAWINVVSRHYLLRTYVKRFEADPKPFLPRSLFTPFASAAAMLGERDVLGRMLAVGRPIYEDSLRRFMKKESLRDLAPLGIILAESCLFHVMGEDQRDVWRRMLSLGEPKHAALRGLFALLRAIDTKSESGPCRADLVHPKDERQFLREQKRLSTAELLAIAASPDCASLGELFDAFMHPLAIKRAHELSCDPWLPIVAGAWPERRGNVLASLPQDWAHVEATVSPETWSAIRAMRDSHQCTHVVCYDPSEAYSLEGATKAAAEHYGVRLVTKSLFDM